MNNREATIPARRDEEAICSRREAEFREKYGLKPFKNCYKHAVMLLRSAGAGWDEVQGVMQRLGCVGGGLCGAMLDHPVMYGSKGKPMAIVAAPYIPRSDPQAEALGLLRGLGLHAFLDDQSHYSLATRRVVAIVPWMGPVRVPAGYRAYERILMPDDEDPDFRRVRDLATRHVREALEMIEGSGLEPSDVAIATSLVGERNAGQAEMMVRNSVKGLRDFSGPAGVLLKRAGIRPDTPYLDAIQKLAPVVKAEAAAGPKGTTVNDVLKKYFHNERTVYSLETEIGNVGMIDQRRGIAGKNAGPAAALGMIERYEASPGGARRKADAQAEQSAIERGAEYSGVDTVQRQAYAELLREKALSSPSAALGDWWTKKMSFDMIPNAERERINNRAADILQRRAARGGVPTSYASGLLGEGVNSWAMFSGRWVTDQKDSLKASMDLIERHGVDPLRDQDEKKAGGKWEKPPAQAAPVQNPQAMNETNQHLRRLTALQEQQMARQNRTPMARPLPSRWDRGESMYRV